MGSPDGLNADVGREGLTFEIDLPFSSIGGVAKAVRLDFPMNEGWNIAEFGPISYSFHGALHITARGSIQYEYCEEYRCLNLVPEKPKQMPWFTIHLQGIDSDDSKKDERSLRFYPGAVEPEGDLRGVTDDDTAKQIVREWSAAVDRCLELLTNGSIGIDSIARVVEPTSVPVIHSGNYGFLADVFSFDQPSVSPSPDDFSVLQAHVASILDEVAVETWKADPANYFANIIGSTHDPKYPSQSGALNSIKWLPLWEEVTKRKRPTLCASHDVFYRCKTGKRWSTKKCSGDGAPTKGGHVVRGKELRKAKKRGIGLYHPNLRQSQR